MIKKLKYILLLLCFTPILTLGLLSKNYEKSGDLHVKMLKNSQESTEFVEYWRYDFRLDNHAQVISICDITYNSYKEMFDKYKELSENDRKVVDGTADYEEGYTIKDSITELVARFENTSDKGNKKLTLTNSNTIITVVVVAVFGMSVICVFFALKSGNLIK